MIDDVKEIKETELKKARIRLGCERALAKIIDMKLCGNISYASID